MTPVPRTAQQSTAALLFMLKIEQQQSQNSRVKHPACNSRQPKFTGFANPCCAFPCQQNKGQGYDVIQQILQNLITVLSRFLEDGSDGQGVSKFFRDDSRDDITKILLKLLQGLLGGLSADGLNEQTECQDSELDPVA